MALLLSAYLLHQTQYNWVRAVTTPVNQEPAIANFGIITGHLDIRHILVKVIDSLGTGALNGLC